MSSLEMLATKTVVPTRIEDVQAAVDAVTERIHGERAKEPKKLDLNHLPVLRNELCSLEEQLIHRQRVVNLLAPVVEELRQKVQALKDGKKHLLDGADFVNVRAEVQAIDRKLDHYESQLKAEEDRKLISSRLVNHWTKQIADWHGAHDDEFNALCELDKKIEEAMPRVGRLF